MGINDWADLIRAGSDAIRAFGSVFGEPAEPQGYGQAAPQMGGQGAPQGYGQGVPQTGGQHCIPSEYLGTWVAITLDHPSDRNVPTNHILEMGLHLHFNSDSFVLQGAGTYPVFEFLRGKVPHYDRMYDSIASHHGSMILGSVAQQLSPRGRPYMTLRAFIGVNGQMLASGCLFSFVPSASVQWLLEDFA